MQKFIFAVVTLFITIVSNSLVLPVLSFLLMSGAIIFAARIPVIFYGKLLLLPLFFLMGSTLMIATNAIVPDMMLSISLFDNRVGVSPESLFEAGRLLMKAMGAVSCLYFLTLTVPVTEIINILKKLKVPVLFLELLMLVYKFIFITFETMNRIYVSQNSRLGYGNYKTVYKSLSKLIASMFIISLKRYEDMYRALESRCFTGDFHFYQREYLFSKTGMILIIMLDGLLLGIDIFSWGSI